MARQTVKPFQWIVLCDGDEPTKCTMGQQFIYCPEVKGSASLSKKFQLLLRTNIVKGDAIIIAEDDDFYSPNWLEFCQDKLAHFDLIGEGMAVYYNVSGRWWYEHGNMSHSSFCSTAFKRSIFPILLEVSENPNPFLDARLWKAVVQRKKVFNPFENPSKKRLVVGMKGLPGRKGYGQGHVNKDPSAKDDLDLSKLKSLIGDDYLNYVNFFGGKRMKSHLTETHKAHGANWSKWLGHLKDKPNVIGMELGTFKGESAEWMLENIFTSPESIYYCVDNFKGSEEHHIGKIDCSTLEKDTMERLAGFQNKIIIKGNSNEVLRNFDKLLDVAYCDAAHDAMNVLRDSVLVFDLLKVGGILIWDDFLWDVFKDELDRPKIAIESFIKIYSRRLEILEPRGWQIAARKLS
jgi:predicted O-methyltransferase YrrM